MAPQLGTTDSGSNEHRYSNIHGGDNMDESSGYQEEERYYISYNTNWPTEYFVINLLWYFLNLIAIFHY